MFDCPQIAEWVSKLHELIDFRNSLPLIDGILCGGVQSFNVVKLLLLFYGFSLYESWDGTIKSTTSLNIASSGQYILTI